MKNLVLLISFVFSFTVYSQTKVVYLASEMNEIHVLDDLSEVEMWGYGFIKSSGAYQAELPGPILEFNLGDTVEIHFHNKSPEDHTIHLHGLDVSTEEDGVPSTSFAVAPWDSTVYNFVAKNTGSFLYHCHVLTTLHLTMGMYGVIVVKNYPDSNLIYAGGPSFHKEHVFLASDMDRSVNENPLSPGPFNLFVMDYFMINGLSGNSLLNSADNQVTAYPGDSVLLRLSSMGYSKTQFIFPSELNAIAYISDGRVLPVPMPCDTLTVFPGERYEVLLVPDEITDVDIQVLSFECRNDVLQHINYIALNEDVSIQDNNANGLKIFPNPTNGLFVFETEILQNSLQIFDVSGKLIFQEFIQNHQTQIDLSAFQKGVYFLKYGERTGKVILN